MFSKVSENLLGLIYNNNSDTEDNKVEWKLIDNDHSFTYNDSCTEKEMKVGTKKKANTCRLILLRFLSTGDLPEEIGIGEDDVKLGEQFQHEQ
jgi:hypothetical protein